MAEGLGTGAQNAQADAIGTALDDGTLKIYTTPRPASPNDDPTGATLLVTFDFAADAFDPADGGVADLEGPMSASAVADGEADWFRMTSGDGTQKYDGDVSELPDETGELWLDNINIEAGQTVTINTGDITQPAS